jgi:hypothetical protein
MIRLSALPRLLACAPYGQEPTPLVAITSCSGSGAALQLSMCLGALYTAAQVLSMCCTVSMCTLVAVIDCVATVISVAYLYDNLCLSTEIHWYDWACDSLTTGVQTDHITTMRTCNGCY